MATLIFTLLTTTLKQAIVENTNLNALTYVYCPNNAITLLNTANSLKT